MQPAPSSRPDPARPRPSAGALNGSIWAIIALCLLAIFIGRDLAFLALLLVLPWTLVLGAFCNLCMGLWLLATERSRLAPPYFLGFVPLALLAGWLWYELSHMGKFFGG